LIFGLRHNYRIVLAFADAFTDNYTAGLAVFVSTPLLPAFGILTDYPASMRDYSSFTFWTGHN